MRVLVYVTSQMQLGSYQHAPDAVADRERIIGEDQDVTPCRISEVHSVRVFANSRSSSAPSPTPILTLTQLFIEQRISYLYD